MEVNRKGDLNINIKFNIDGVVILTEIQYGCSYLKDTPKEVERVDKWGVFDIERFFVFFFYLIMYLMRLDLK